MLEAAGFWIRLGAMLLDAIIVVIPLAIISLLMTDGRFDAFLPGFICFLYFLLTPIFWEGYTIGKRICGLKIREVKNQASPGIVAMIFRNMIALFVYFITMGIAVIASSVLVVGREDRRAIHDVIAGTEVVHDFKYDFYHSA